MIRGYDEWINVAKATALNHRDLRRLELSELDLHNMAEAAVKAAPGGIGAQIDALKHVAQRLLDREFAGVDA